VGDAGETWDGLTAESGFAAGFDSGPSGGMTGGFISGSMGCGLCFVLSSSMRIWS
jgi:hypothetical protein